MINLNRGAVSEGSGGLAVVDLSRTVDSCSFFTVEGKGGSEEGKGGGREGEGKGNLIPSIQWANHPAALGIANKTGYISTGNLEGERVRERRKRKKGKKEEGKKRKRNKMKINSKKKNPIE